MALAAVLHADACEIYTDVDGVYTTDPRVVPEARQLGQISYDEMLELARPGAGVMHNRSIEFAKKFGVPVHVRSSFSDKPGTMIVAEPEVAGPAGLRRGDDQERGPRDGPGRARPARRRHDRSSRRSPRKNIADGHDRAERGGRRAGPTSPSPCRATNCPHTLKAVEEAVKELGAEGYDCDDEVSKISVVGLGMATQTGVAERMFRALAEKGINIQMITTSEIKISVLVGREHAQEALRTVHEEFQLDKEPPSRRPATAAASGCRAAEQRQRRRRPHGDAWSS